MDEGMTPRLPLSCALAGLEAARGLRAQAEWAGATGFDAVQLDASASEARPRDLGRSARRDIGAILRRAELVCSGIDLWIPPAHFVDAARADRALSAVAEALGLASELAELTGGAPVVSLALPAGAQGDDLLPVLAARAASGGATLADHRWPQIALDSPAAVLIDGRTVGFGVDPAAIMLAESVLADPAMAVSRAGSRLASVRINDLNSSGRTPPGSGRLDLLSLATAFVTNGSARHAVLELRGLRAQDEVARRTVALLGRRGAP